MLLSLYKAMLSEGQDRASLIKQAVEQRKSFSSDIVAFKDEINVPAVA